MFTFLVGFAAFLYIMDFLFPTPVKERARTGRKR